VVNVPNRPHVHVRFRPIEFFLRHGSSPLVRFVPSG
jgi:hypothetical protein